MHGNSNRSNHVFSQVPVADIQRSSFDRSHGFKTTFNAGYLVPIFCDEVLPGDTFNLHLSAFARLATPIKPFMDNLYFDTFFFFVPNRLVWTHWPHFNGQQDNPGDSTAYTIPQQVSLLMVMLLVLSKIISACLPLVSWVLAILNRTVLYRFVLII